MTSNFYLQTARVDLREINKDDFDDLYALNSDPDVMRYLTDGKPSTVEEVQAGLQTVLGLLKMHQGKFGHWAAIERATGAFMGWFLFRPCKKTPENTARIEIGYRLKKKYWGKGYATEVSRILIEKGFQEPGIKEIFAKTMEKNLGSRHVLEKCGLKFVRRYKDEEFPDSPEMDVEYSLVNGVTAPHI